MGTKTGYPYPFVARSITYGMYTNGYIRCYLSASCRIDNVSCIYLHCILHHKVHSEGSKSGIAEKINNPYFTELNEKYNINKISDEEMKLLGLTKKEIKDIKILREKGEIRSNIDLKEIFSEKRYSEIDKSIEFEGE